MKTTGKILVLLPVEQRHRQLLEEKAPGYEFIYTSSGELEEEQLKEAEIILGNPPLNDLAELSNLRWIQLNSAGANQFTVPGVLREGTLLTNATGAYGLAISEYMLGGVLELFKNLHYYRDQQKQHLWKSAGHVKSIYGSTVLVVGLGDIGGEFAKRMKLLGARVLGIKRRLGEKPQWLDELHSMEELDQLLPLADVVAFSLPQTPQTTKLVDARRLSLMKQDAVLVNVGRGTTVDTDALYQALDAEKLLGAVLDVTDPEPLPSDHPIWDLKNIVITPHTSGGYSLPETFERIVRICAENLLRYAKGEELINLVDFQTGYRK